MHRIRGCMVLFAFLAASRAGAQQPAAPIAFEPNRGQAAAGVEYFARDSGSTLSLERNEIAMRLRDAGADASLPHWSELRVVFAGASPRTEMRAAEPLRGVVHYSLGRDRSKWLTNIPTFGRVVYAGAYPGIDVAIYGRHGRLEYDFVVSPHVDPRLIRLRFDGAARPVVTPEGDLRLTTAAGAIVQRSPHIYQERAGRRMRVSGGYLVRGDGTVEFEVGRYDRNCPLVIDPEIVYERPLTDSWDSTIPVGIAVDGSGNAYVAGSGYVAGVEHQAVVVTKLEPGGEPVATHILSGQAAPFAYDGIHTIGQTSHAAGIAVDPTGNVFVTGYTDAFDFPTTAGAFQTTCGGGASDCGQYTDTLFGYWWRPSDVFVTKLDASLNILASTYLGGRTHDRARTIAIDAAGAVYVAGSTALGVEVYAPPPGAAWDFPVNMPLLGYHGNAVESPSRRTATFVSKLGSNLDSLIHSSYFDMGQSCRREPCGEIAAIALNASTPFIAGNSSSRYDFPTTAGVWLPMNPDSTGGYAASAFVAKLEPDWSGLTYATFLGGSSGSSIGGLAVTPDGHAVVTGYTPSDDFPITPLRLAEFSAAGGNGFLTTVAVDGSSLLYSTSLGVSVSDPVDAPNGVAGGIAMTAPNVALVAAAEWADGQYPFVMKVMMGEPAPVYAQGVGSEGTWPMSLAAGADGDAYVVFTDYYGDGSGTVVRIHDPLPQLFVGNAHVVEGNGGTATLQFTVTLSKPTTQTVTVDYVTRDETANAGSDYNAATGTLTFVPGDTAETISVNVVGDEIDENDETFVVELSNPTNATIGQGAGTGKILDDDTAAPPSRLVVTNTLDGGPGSLRDAIDAANENSGAVDAITFNIPGAGPHTIRPLSPLPKLYRDDVIDGTTQPGYAGIPVIELDGSLAGDGADGLTIGMGCTVRGLAIGGFQGNGVHVQNQDAAGAVLERNVIGSDPTGTIERGNGGVGVLLDGYLNKVGGVPDVGNTIAFNQGTGVQVVWGIRNWIAGNRIKSNGGLGIHTGQEQNVPPPAILHSASYDGSRTSIVAQQPYCADCIIEFFANAVCDPSGAGEGETPLGSVHTEYEPPANTIRVSYDTPLPPGQFLTATLSSPDDDPYNHGRTTSPFSACIPVVATPPEAFLSIAKASDRELVPVGELLQYTITVTNTGIVAATNVVITDELAPSLTGSGWDDNCAPSGQNACAVGAIAAGGSVTVRLVATPTETGDVTNVATVTCAECSGAVASPPVTTTVFALPPPLPGTEDGVTSAQGDQYDPAISGNVIVYTDARAGNPDVTYTDPSTWLEHPVVVAPAAQQEARASNGLIVYADATTEDVVLFNAADGTTTNLTAADKENVGHAFSASHPAIGDGLVAWVDTRDGNAEIYAKDLGTGDERRITSSLAIDGSPAVGGRAIVWERCTEDGVNCDIWRYDWPTAVTTPITATPSWRERAPDIDGGRISYFTNREGGSDICLFDVATIVETCLPLPGNQSNPHVHGGNVSFDDLSTGRSGIGLWHVPTHEVFRVTPVAFEASENDIDGNRIVYTDTRDGERNIRMFTFATDAWRHLTVHDVSVVEGNSGTTQALFTVRLSTASTAPVTVDYATADGTAAAGADYTALSGTLTFAPGTTSLPVVVAVNGDTIDEPDETFTLVLSNPAGAELGVATAIGTIEDDDLPIANVEVIEQITVRDAAAATKSAMVGVSESVIVHDEPVLTPSVMIAVPEMVAVHDGPAAAPAATIAVAETVHVTDNASTTVPNTPVGSGVVVQLPSPWGSGAIILTFPSVTKTGDTTLTVAPATLPPPQGYACGTPPLAYEISTTASFTGPVTVSIDFGGIAFARPLAIRLFHFEASQWVDITVSLDAAGHTVTGLAQSFSPFVVVEAIERDTSPPEIAIVTPTATTYRLHENVIASYACTDSESGVASCAGSVPSGEAIDTSVEGTHEFLVTAQDVAGNSAAGAVTYVVTAFEGRMSGTGTVRAPDGSDHHFAFAIAERHLGFERGHLAYEVRTPKGGNQKARTDRFESTSVGPIVFWDDPAFVAGRGHAPAVDSVNFAGEGRWNGHTGYTFEARASDRGEPGRGRDTFAITIRDRDAAIVATIDGELGAGNIQSERLPLRSTDGRGQREGQRERDR